MMKYEFSKIIAVVSMVLFIFTLLFGLGVMLYLILTGNSTVLDFGVFATAITITGGLFAMVSRSYYSKSGLQNVAQIRKSVYREIMDVRLDYDRKVLQMRKRYNVDQDVINEIENDAPFKSLSEAVISQTTTKLDEVDYIHESEPTTDL